LQSFATTVYNEKDGIIIATSTQHVNNPDGLPVVIKESLIGAIAMRSQADTPERLK
jgi:hypothetical protein